MTRSMQTLALTALALVLASSALAADSKVVIMEGSTTVGPIADAYVEVFKKSHPDVTITVNKTGSGNGAAALVDGRCDIANMSRFMKGQEFKDAVAKGVMPVAHTVAMDGVCPIVHPSNPIKELTIDQLRDIYMGKVTNWKQLGGADQKIVVVSRDTSSGTYETFEKLVMNKQKMADSVQYVASNPEAHAKAKSPAGVRRQENQGPEGQRRRSQSPDHRVGQVPDQPAPVHVHQRLSQTRLGRPRPGDLPPHPQGAGHHRRQGVRPRDGLLIRQILNA